MPNPEDQAVNNIIETIKSLANMEHEKTKIKSNLMLDEIYRQRDFAYKQKERTAERQDKTNWINQVITKGGFYGGQPSGQPTGQESAIPSDGQPQGQEQQDQSSGQDVLSMQIPQYEPTITESGIGIKRTDPGNWIFRQIAGKHPSDRTPDEQQIYNTKIGIKEVSIKESDKVLGNLSQKGYREKDGDFKEFKNREDAERYAESNLGLGWQKKFPKAVGILDKKYLPPAKERLKPDNFGYTLGEEKSISGKGRYQYIGDNKWKKVEMR